MQKRANHFVNIHTYRLQVAITTLKKEYHEGIPILKSLLTNNPLSPGKPVGRPHHRSLRTLLFSKSGVDSFATHKNQIRESAVGGYLRFFVLIREDSKV